MIGETSSRSSCAGRSGQHGEAPVVPAARHRGGGARRRLEQRDEVAAGDVGDDVGADQRGGDRLVLVRGGRPGVGARSGARRRSRRRSATSTVTAPSNARRVRTSRPPSTSSTSTAAGAPRSGMVQAALRCGQIQRSEHDLAFDRLVPRQPGAGRRDELVDRHDGGRCASACSACRCCNCRKRDHERQRRRRPSTSSRVASVSSSPSPASAAPGGPSTPNCQRRLVLARRRAVGVEQVALVEHRVGDRAGMIPADGHRCFPDVRWSTRFRRGTGNERADRVVEIEQAACGTCTRSARRWCRGSAAAIPSSG